MELPTKPLDRGVTMTKAELVELIAGGTGISKKDTGIVVNLILDNIGKALEAGDKVELRGFGSFKVKSRRSRLARNPRTGDSVDVPSKQVPYFKASNELKAKLNLDKTAEEETSGI
jgi:integration host factor subunit beta